MMIVALVVPDAVAAKAFWGTWARADGNRANETNRVRSALYMVFIVLSNWAFIAH